MAISPTNNIQQSRAQRYALELAKKYNLRLTSAFRSPALDKQVGGSGRGDHTKGLAYDFAGNYLNMDKFANELHKSGMYKQIIFKDKDYKTGRRIPNHQNHVHVAWFVPEGYSPENKNGLVQNGEKGGIVETIQQLLGGLKIDGFFGPNTEKAVKDFQEKHNLQVDGIVGRETWESLSKGGISVFF